MKLAKTYTDLADLDKLNWDCIYTRDWKNTEENYQKRDLKQAEFLVKHHLPIDLVSAIVVINEEKKTYIEQQLHIFGMNIPVHIDKEYKLYYP
jgi:hypothetical protein